MTAFAVGGRDVPLLFVTRAVRLFAYGFLSLVLVLYLAAVGLDERSAAAGGGQEAVVCITVTPCRT
jgi:hypothetical protein